ncbi:hypothetical protein Tco_0841757 [Tanacetum coccineum]|uniref:Uncharacterized protein n=1 Tax=Tanacetum coccineum TaxID=301880 RepID=A0ABQ5AXB1_9ASTR
MKVQEAQKKYVHTQVANSQQPNPQLMTDCQAIISFYNKANSNKSSRVRWIKFADALTGTGVKINIEHIEGKHNTLVDSLSRLVHLCFAECTEEMRQLTAATLYSVEEVLQSPYASQKNMKNTYKESPKTLSYQQQKKLSKPCETYNQSYNAKLKSTLECQLKTTTGLTKRKTSEFKTNKPEEFSSNWKPLHNDWAVTTSKPKEAQDYFLEDDECNDDSIFIVDPGWDDYCHKALKLNRLEMKDARRARM